MRFWKLSFVVPLAAAVGLYTGSATPAHAYLDPGTGSMILQVLLGGAAGLTLAGKLYWRRFLSVIGVRSDDEPGKPGQSDIASTTAPRADN